ncbi:E3 ubiquitin-protein ligase SINA-like 10 isoform X1 [Triticum urartu]|uniref:E3 ubiquitin-protein ligase SINA-like 10 isoform X1 n=1 Tax=Triticum urartu TaxID=4572 RepID=UPI0020436B6E|nr:E3 ubiquitin-protein ligase SINA-like 10 isoform X1 [Triticum urartu]
MAKFSFADADADEDPPPATAAAAGSDKRKRDGSPAPDDGAAGGGPPPKARRLEVAGGEREERAVAGCGREVGRVGAGGDGDAVGISMRIDPDLLDCSICFEPLCPPLYQLVLCIFQCQNGHVACLSCWSRLSNKCHVCSHDAIFARNIALEKIVESIKSSCAYAKWGCCELVSYTQRNSHEESCLFAPLMCPIPGCGYRGFTGCWSGHFLVDHHSADFLHFAYGQSFEVNLEASLPFLVLLGEDDHLFLLLNKNMTPFGHAFSVVCLRTGDLNWKFSYEIEAASTRNPENCLQLKASVTNAKEWAGLHPTKAFLLVPYDFCSSTNLNLNVSVGRSVSV